MKPHLVFLLLFIVFTTADSCLDRIKTQGKKCTRCIKPLETCEYLAEAGHCKWDYMRTYCCKTCLEVDAGNIATRAPPTVPPSCKDWAEWCPLQAHANMCLLYGWNVICCKSCGLHWWPRPTDGPATTPSSWLHKFGTEKEVLERACTYLVL